MKKVTLAELKEIAIASKESLQDSARKYGRNVKVYLHWTAGHYGQTFDHYHINIDSDGSIILHYDDLSELTQHTYKRNTGAIGIALLCCAFATTENLGDEPPTELQIEVLAQVVAVLSSALGLTIDINSFMTHAEAANNMDGIDPGYEDNGYEEGRYGPGYNCERWDLAILKAEDEMMSGGGTIRGKSNYYKEKYGL